jgi:APA family basic amino acid/polyamine antiporter
MSAPEPSRRQLGLFSATAAVIATMIGAGIFGATDDFATNLGSDFSVLLVWFFCGLLALTGALSFGELGSMMPRAGGVYIFMRHIYGPAAGYLTGVLTSLLGFVGAIAYIALLLGHHVQQFLPECPVWLSACVATVGFSLLHCLALRESTRVNNAFTVFKVAVIVVFIVAGFMVLGTAQPPAEISRPGLFDFGNAMILASFAYLGWETTTYIGSELKNPSRTLPYSLLIGTAVVTALYLLLNAVFLRAMHPMEMTEDGVGLQAAQRLFGPVISTWFNWMIIFVLLSTISTVTMVGGRILQSMARAGQLPARLTRRNRHDAPANAILAQGAVTLIFILIASSTDRAAYLGEKLRPDPDGARINHVMDGSPAKVAGLQAEDLITQLGTNKVTSNADLRKLLGEKSAGDIIPLMVKRGQKTREVKVTLGSTGGKNQSGNILNFIGLPITIIMGAAVVGVFLMRRREPGRERPFRVPLYPFTPMLFILLAVMMVASSIDHEPMVALYSAITILVVWALKPALAWEGEKAPESESGADNGE